MAGAYGYTPDEMRSVGTTLIKTQADIGTSVSAAQSAVSGLIGSGFTTQAASGAYSEQFAALSKGLQEVANNLEPLGNFLTQYAEAVESMDSQMAGQLRG